MPPETVTCSICRLEVPKRQTVEIKKGKRACRGHKATKDLIEADDLKREHRTKMSGAHLDKADQERLLEELAWSYANASNPERVKMKATITVHYGRFFAEQVVKYVASRSDPRHGS